MKLLKVSKYFKLSKHSLTFQMYLANACLSSPCLNGGICYAYANEYYCLCTTLTNGKNCQFINWCYSSPCLNGGTCGPKDDGSYYKCNCPADYGGTNCEYCKYTNFITLQLFINFYHFSRHNITMYNCNMFRLWFMYSPKCSTKLYL